MRLLVMRPGADADRTARALRARGHEVAVVPVLQFDIMANVDLGAGPFAAIAMTSANAVRAIEQHPGRAGLTHLPVFTVGHHTAAAAQAAGFAQVMSAAGGLPELTRLIAAKLLGGRVLYLAAADRSGDLAGALAPHRIAVETIVVYRMATNPLLAQDLGAALDAWPDGALHYSRRSAQTFLVGAGTAGRLDAALRLTHYCLSAEVAAPLAAAGATAVKVAPRPEEAALLELL
jgi:uroporphyrinogen-III synthase